MDRMNKFTLLGAVISAFSGQIIHLRDKTVELMHYFITEVIKLPHYYNSQRTVFTYFMCPKCVPFYLLSSHTLVLSQSYLSQVFV